MFLTPWKKGREISPIRGFRHEMDRLFDEFFGRTPSRGWAEKEFAPSVDVRETDDQVIVEAEVPGINPSDIDVRVVGNALVISGERKDVREEKTKFVHRVERLYGRFEREIELPAYADADRIDAHCKDGVLTIAMPKRAEAKTRSVHVKAE
jgi:HSP20 family protein